METFVVPRYLSLFGEPMLEMLLAGDAAAIAHLGCRTGYPDRLLLERVPGARITSVDVSAPALELARNKAALMNETRLEYLLADGLPTELPDESYSHAVCLHPIATDAERAALFVELARLLYAGGQALVALPLRGSFQEVGDLLREFALKSDDGELGKAVEHMMATRATIETLSEELEVAGLDDVDVELRSSKLTFDSGRAFLEDPVTRLLITPTLVAALAPHDLTRPLEYVREAVDKYWSEGKFELSLNIGCASARRS